MPAQVRVYEFTDTAFVVGSDPIVCVVAAGDLRRYFSVAEINSAFSGFASYRSLLGSDAMSGSGVEKTVSG
jgi:hypothetical protein